MQKELETWSFGTDNDKLIELVLKGEKRATTSLYNEYIHNNESLPKVGDRGILVYDNKKKACITEVKKVIITEFKNITKQLAMIEGEGDKSLEYYRNEHIKIFSSFYPEFNDDSKVVFEIFDVIEMFNNS